MSNLAEWRPPLRAPLLAFLVFRMDVGRKAMMPKKTQALLLKAVI